MPTTSRVLPRADPRRERPGTVSVPGRSPFRRGIADDIDWIGVRPNGGKRRVQRGERLIGKRCERAALVDELVDRKHTGSPAIGDDCDAPAGQRGKTRGDRCCIEQTLEIIDPNDACAPQRRINDPVNAGKRSGMRPRRLGGCLVTAGLYGNHRLEPRGRPRSGHELAGRRYGFEIHQDR